MHMGVVVMMSSIYNIGWRDIQHLRVVHVYYGNLKDCPLLQLSYLTYSGAQGWDLVFIPK
jgi:hypothetical protein